MDSKSREFILSEFIGEEVLVKSSADRSRQGLKGRILDETKNTFAVKTLDGRKVVVPKKGSVFVFIEHGVEVDGSLVALRPEDRTKMLAKKLAKR